VLNLAPALDVPDALLVRADVIVVNESEAGFYGARLDALPARIVRTYGAAGAAMFKTGREMARAVPPPIEAIDTTGAGDCFVAALTVALAEGFETQAALHLACAAAALACTKEGAQPSFPVRSQL
jgi:ribokinase